jgi:hypothetical protein
MTDKQPVQMCFGPKNSFVRKQRTDRMI